MEAIFEKIKLQLDAGKPFVLYRKPGANTVYGLLQEDGSSNYVKTFGERGFAFAPFHGKHLLLIPQNGSQHMSAEVIPHPESASSPPLDFDYVAKTDFELLVQKGIDAIKDGKFEKVVLSRVEKMEMPDLDLFTTFTKLLNNYPAAFVHLWFHPETGTWMGATPEKLLQADKTHFKTMALAGTQKYEGTEQAGWQPKEKREQQFVTDFITASLVNFTSGLEITEPYTYRAGNLLHIRTDIEGDLNAGAGLEDIISVLHPTPAVCGLPKLEAREFILEHEGYNREYYAGFLGEVNTESGTDLYVNLRCMKVAGNEVRLYIGCGITKDSDPGKEFLETVNKSLTLKKALVN